ncbi:MAG: (2Fe-2S)-binding protein [Candidatus Limnocylindria bacterium]
MTAPAWERLAAPEGVRLHVARPESVETDLLDVDEGDLPAFAGATVINAWRAADDRYVVWAARIDGTTALTYVIHASELSIRAADAALARLIGFDPASPPPGIRWVGGRAEDAATGRSDVVCSCEGITRERIEAAISSGARSVDAVKRATKATFGACQSRICAPAIAAMLGLATDEPRAAITPRPPLVPVPASVLAAFATPD